MSTFDPYHKWLGIPPKDQPPNLYRLLGIERFESDRDVIEAAANRLMAYLQDLSTGESADAAQSLLNEVAAARLRLLSPGKKAAYDQRLKAELSRAAEPQDRPPARAKTPPQPALSAPQIAIQTEPSGVGRPPTAESTVSRFTGRLAVVATITAAAVVILLLLTVVMSRMGRTPDANAAGNRDAGVALAPDQGVAEGAVIKVDWPASERPGASMTVNGMQRHIPMTGVIEFRVDSGVTEFVFARPDYHDIVEKMNIRSGEVVRLSPHWTPALVEGHSGVTPEPPETPPAESATTANPVEKTAGNSRAARNRRTADAVRIPPPAGKGPELKPVKLEPKGPPPRPFAQTLPANFELPVRLSELDQRGSWGGAVLHTSSGPIPPMLELRLLGGSELFGRRIRYELIKQPPTDGPPSWLVVDLENLEPRPIARFAVFDKLIGFEWLPAEGVDHAERLRNAAVELSWHDIKRVAFLRAPLTGLDRIIVPTVARSHQIHADHLPDVSVLRLEVYEPGPDNKGKAVTVAAGETGQLPLRDNRFAARIAFSPKISTGDVDISLRLQHRQDDGDWIATDRGDVQRELERMRVARSQAQLRWQQITRQTEDKEKQSRLFKVSQEQFENEQKAMGRAIQRLQSLYNVIKSNKSLPKVAFRLSVEFQGERFVLAASN